MKFASIGLRAAYQRALSSLGGGRRDERSGESGLTLLEVLVALTILAIAVTSLFEAQATATRATRTTEHTAEARLVVQARMEETLATWDGGRHARSGNALGYAWRVSISPEISSWAHMEEANWRLYRVQATVERDGKHLVTLDTLRLGAAR